VSTKSGKDQNSALVCKSGPDFCGSDYDSAINKKRLTGQLERVFKVLSDGKYHTLKEVERLTGDPQASISAQIRHLRKPAFGGYEIAKRRRTTRITKPTGSWEYALILEANAA
jgi:hypothetical protein